MKPKTIDPKKLMTEPVDDSDHETGQVMKYIDHVENMVKNSTPPQKFFAKLKYSSSVKLITKEIAAVRKINSEKDAKNEIKRRARIINRLANIVELKGLFDVRGWSNTFKIAMDPISTMLIFMELRTGKFVHFIVSLKHPYFDYQDGRYIVDDEMKYYLASSSMWCCDYHQDCCLPLKRKIDVNQINREVTNLGIDTETSINPVSFKVFMESDIIQKVIKGAEMDQWLGFVKTMLIVLICMLMISIVMGIYIITKVKKI
jgi:hypothetical protein